MMDVLGLLNPTIPFINAPIPDPLMFKGSLTYGLGLRETWAGLGLVNSSANERDYFTAKASGT